MNHTRRAMLLGAAALTATAAGSGAWAQEKLPLEAISGYLNQLQTATGRFQQINADGTKSVGTIYIKRPGRVRFEYDPPERTMVIAGGGQLAVFDPRSDEPTRFPLNQTPLHIILKRDVDLAQARMVVGHAGQDGVTTVRVQDPENPDYGSIDLVFTSNPVALRQWVINDGDGGRTQMVLGALQTGGRVPERLFNIRAEMRDWGQ